MLHVHGYAGTARDHARHESREAIENAGLRVAGIDRVEARGERTQFDRNVRRHACGALPGEHTLIARDVCARFRFRQHRFADSVDRDLRAAAGELPGHAGNRSAVLFDQEESRHTRDARAHRPCHERMISGIQQAPPWSLELVVRQAGTKVARDCFGAIECGEHVDEVEQCATQLLVSQRLREQRTAHTAGAEERGRRLRSRCVERFSELCNRRF